MIRINLTRLRRLLVIAAVLAVVLSSGALMQAAPVLYCKSGPGIDLTTAGCISGTAKGYPQGGDGIYSNAGGGDGEDAVETAILGATGLFVDILPYGKSDSNPSFFSFKPTKGSSLTESLNGTWTVADGTIISYITIKAGNSFALYQVNGSTGTYTTEGMKNNGGKQPTVSHMSFWTVPSPVTETPEPGTVAMLGAGLVGLGMLRYRKSRV